MSAQEYKQLSNLFFSKMNKWSQKAASSVTIFRWYRKCLLLIGSLPKAFTSLSGLTVCI